MVEKPSSVKVCVNVQGDSVEVDLTGSAEQTPTAMNVPLDGSTKPAAYFAFRALLLDSATLDSHLPANEGSFARYPLMHRKERFSTHAFQQLPRHPLPRYNE